MIKNNNGVTLMILITIVVVLLIITGITITIGNSSIKKISDEKSEINLSVIQEVLIQQYTLLKSKGELGRKATIISSDVSIGTDGSRPADFIGTRLATTTKLTSNGFNNYLVEYNQENMCYEDYYYYLTLNDLKKLKIDTENKNKVSEYVVNYSTGEVFDITNKQYNKTTYDETGNNIYLRGTNSQIDNKTYNFTDE